MGPLAEAVGEVVSAPAGARLSSGGAAGRPALGPLISAGSPARGESEWRGTPSLGAWQSWNWGPQALFHGVVTNALPGAGGGKGVRVTWASWGWRWGRASAAAAPRPAPPQLVSRGCGARELALPNGSQGRLGLRWSAPGFITHVERFTFAETAGLRPGRACSRVRPDAAQPRPRAAAQLLRLAPKVCVTVLPPTAAAGPAGQGAGRKAVGGLGSLATAYAYAHCVPLATGTLRGFFL